MVAYPKLFYIMQVLTIYLKHSDHNSIGQWQPMLKDFFWGGGDPLQLRTLSPGDRHQLLPVIGENMPACHKFL